MLRIFLTLRDFANTAPICRTAGFLGLMAAMTLLLAHMCPYQGTADGEDPLAHQYSGDLAMIEQAGDQMRQEPHNDTLGIQSAELLSKLLALETEAVSGRQNLADSVVVQSTKYLQGGDRVNEANNTSTSVHIPYFGFISMHSKGLVTNHDATSGSLGKERSDHESGSALMRSFGSAGGVRRTNSFAAVPKPPPHIPFPSVTNSSIDTNTQSTLALPETYGWDTNFAPQLSDTVFHNPFRYGQATLTAGVEEWALQGVDLAYFDSFLRNKSFGGADWSTGL